MAECESVCEHAHLPLQSGSDRVLSMLRRGHTTGDVIRAVELCREYDLVPIVDFIVGALSKKAPGVRFSPGARRLMPDA